MAAAAADTGVMSLEVQFFPSGEVVTLSDLTPQNTLEEVMWRAGDAAISQPGHYSPVLPRGLSAVGKGSLMQFEENTLGELGIHGGDKLVAMTGGTRPELLIRNYLPGDGRFQFKLHFRELDTTADSVVRRCFRRLGLDPADREGVRLVPAGGNEALAREARAEPGDYELRRSDSTVKSAAKS
jgi:hypothetical protein